MTRRVLVAGGGGAGLAAALAARERGAGVTVLESEAAPGGSTALSGTTFYAAGSRLQAAAGIDDSPDAMFRDYLEICRYRVNAAAVRRLADESAPALHRLIDLGAGYRVDGVRSSGPAPGSVPRGHYNSGPRGSLLALVERACRERGVEIHCRQRVTALVAGGGRVTGVRCGDAEWTGDAVVVATGGFARNRALLQRHYPAALSAGGWVGSDAGAGCRGDAIALGAGVGAAMGGEDRGLVVPVPRVHHLQKIGDPIYVNAAGRRFVDESIHYSFLSDAMRAEGGPVFAVFDETIRRRITGDTAPAATFRLDNLRLNFHGAGPSAAAEARAARADSPAELGRALGVDPAALAATVERYSAGAARGLDGELVKDPRHLQPIVTPPFYGVEMRPAVVVVTGYGMLTDAEARVVDARGEPIPGLFAAGEAAPSVFGDVYVASGISIANAFVFGQIAGANAAMEVLGHG